MIQELITSTKLEEIFLTYILTGTTPEGLCFEDIMDDFVPSTTDRDSYFLNFSDGMLNVQ